MFIAGTIAGIAIAVIGIVPIVATTMGAAAIGIGTIRAPTTGGRADAWSSARCGSARKI